MAGILYTTHIYNGFDIKQRRCRQQSA